MRFLLLLAVLVAGCSKGPEADLQYIKQVRSLAAEWALVNEQEDAGKLTHTYARKMRGWVRDGLESSVTALSAPDTRYGGEIRVLLEQPDDAPAEELRAHADVLKQIEDDLESA